MLIPYALQIPVLQKRLPCRVSHTLANAMSLWLSAGPSSFPRPPSSFTSTLCGPHAIKDIPDA
jgi:hypothetical protein